MTLSTVNSLAIMARQPSVPNFIFDIFRTFGIWLFIVVEQMVVFDKKLIEPGKRSKKVLS
jgi:hypothetical protein